MVIKLNKKNPIIKDLFTKKYKPKIVKPKKGTEETPMLTFDDTKESPVIYGEDLQIPAFIRRQHD